MCIIDVIGWIPMNTSHKKTPLAQWQRHQQNLRLYEERLGAWFLLPRRQAVAKPRKLVRTLARPWQRACRIILMLTFHLKSISAANLNHRVWRRKLQRSKIICWILSPSKTVASVSCLRSTSQVLWLMHKKDPNMKPKRCFIWREAWIMSLSVLQT